MPAALSKRSPNKKNAFAQGSLSSEKYLTASGMVPGERKPV